MHSDAVFERCRDREIGEESEIEHEIADFVKHFVVSHD